MSSAPNVAKGKSGTRSRFRIWSPIQGKPATVGALPWTHAEFWSERIVLRYGAALLMVAAAAVLSFLLQLFSERALSFPFYVAVVVSTWIGIGPGLLTILCSAMVVDYLWIPPLYTLGIDDENWSWYLVFTGSALVSLLWTWQRRNTERALETTVARRTAELVSANLALRDEIAERQAAEAELQEAQAEVARTLRLTTVAETAAAIAHETNQPLAAIAANASACMRSLKREPPMLDLAREAAGCIVEDANRAAEVIARVRALLNKEGPKRQAIDVNRTVEDVLALTRGSIDRQGIVLRVELSDRLPNVFGDAIQLQQVLLNLVTNGIEAMSAAAKGPRVLTLRSTLGDAGAVVVAVEDSGVGIDPKQATRVFDSFYTTKPNGIGVGLSISRSIIEAHGGRLWLDTMAPCGARFCFELPVVGPGTK
jgi:C4-dicarboxylate-specific signal transduction histidine kinase